MRKFWNKRTILSLLISLSAVVLTILIILFAQGYSFSPKTKKVEKTGLLVLTSAPNGASIYINGHLTDATNTTMKLTPGTYEVEIKKEGYIPWKKKLTVAEGLVTAADAVLFPALPELRPLTFFGVFSPVLSPDGTKIAFKTNEKEKAGIWILNMAQKPLSFSKRVYQTVKDTKEVHFSEGEISWSPDGENLLVSFEEGKTVFLLNPNLTAEKQKPVDITPTLEIVQAKWEEEKRKEEEVLLDLLPDYLKKIATESAKKAVWSPGGKKFLYQTEDGTAKVFDPKWEQFPPREQKEKKGKVFELPKALDYLWLPGGKNGHVILVEKDKISIVESEGTNKAIVYGGEFEENFVAPWPDGSKLVILTSLNKPAGTPPSLYTISLR